jgi:hypothetical protein
MPWNEGPYPGPLASTTPPASYPFAGAMLVVVPSIHRIGFFMKDDDCITIETGKTRSSGFPAGTLPNGKKQSPFDENQFHPTDLRHPGTMTYQFDTSFLDRHELLGNLTHPQTRTPGPLGMDCLQPCPFVAEMSSHFRLLQMSCCRLHTKRTLPHHANMADMAVPRLRY